MAEYRGFGRAALGALAMAMIASCGGDDGDADSPQGGAGASASSGDGGAGSSGGGGGGQSVASGTPATELTAAQVQEICLRIEIDDREESCLRNAVFESSDPESCENHFESCLASSSRGAGDDCDGEAIVEAIAGCDDSVSVGELEGCLSEMVDSGRELDCDDAGRAAPPECLKDLAAWCPEAFEEPDGDRPPDTGSGDGCPDEDGSAEVDCEAFCDPLATAGCDDGPTAQECLELCGVARRECPRATRALSDCIADNGGQWQCSEGEPESAACSAELECWGPCLEMIVERFN